MKSYNIIVTSSGIIAFSFIVMTLIAMNSTALSASILNAFELETEESCIDKVATWEENIINCFHKNPSQLKAEINLIR